MNEYKLQSTTVWSFPERGNWCTHKGDYRGNWSPHIPKNLILRYSKPHDIVLDCFAGSGTTLTECLLNNRNCIGIDINPKAIEITKSRLNFQNDNPVTHSLLIADAQNLNMLEDNSIDFICTHPPYADIIKYSVNTPNDISLCNYTDFLECMNNVAKELHRVIKPGHFCSFMIGDIRKNTNVIPLGFLTLQKFINNGFILKEIIIKEQHNCKSTPQWINKVNSLNFYLLAHEYIFVLYKDL